MVRLKKWALILTCTAFLFVISINVRAYSYEMYDLENIVTNGDFKSTVTGWSGFAVVNSWDSTNEWLVSTGTGAHLGAYSYYIFDDDDFILNHKYYVSCEIYNNNIFTLSNRLYFADKYLGLTDIGDKKIIQTELQPPEFRRQSDIITLDTAYTANSGVITIAHIYSSSTYSNGADIFIDNLMVIDLTASFGFGKEPSKSDFESLYLANVAEYQNTGYFQSYSSYVPESYIVIDQADYSNIVEDLTEVDYTKSVISNYGDNVTIDMYAYVEPRISLTYDWLNIDHYINNNFPELKYLDNLYTLTWERVDYSDHVIHLVMSDIQQDIFKRILFNRNIDFDNEYFHLKVEASAYTQVSLWFEISTAFNLKVGIKSILLSRDTDTLNDFNMVNALYYKFIDISGDLMLPALKVNIGDTQKTTYMDDFGSQYSDISEFIIAFDVNSPSDLAPYTYEDHYLYELGLFSSNNVFIPTMPTSSELEAMFPNDICDWYQFGCHINNSINNIGETLYVKLNVPAIVAVFADIIASITSIVAIVPDDIAIIIYIILGAVGTGLTILLVERIL